MYSKTNQRIREITRQLNDLGYILVEAEGDEYSETLQKIEELQEELEFLEIQKADMETMKEFLQED